MKKLLLSVFLASGLNCFGQTETSKDYLLVRFTQHYDNTNERSYFAINAESGCDTAKEIYSLLWYDYRKKAINTGGIFYPSSSDTAVKYNYFSSTTQALNYLSKKGWELLTIYPEIFSGYDTQSASSTSGPVPITIVSSRSVFCFKK